MYQELIIIIYYLQNNTDGYANPDADLTLKGQRGKRTIWNQLGQRESQIKMPCLKIINLIPFKFVTLWCEWGVSCKLLIPLSY